MNTTRPAGNATQRHTRRTAAALVALAALSLAACGDEDDASDSAADLTAFCAKAVETNQPDNALPSPELLAEYQALAPDEISDPVAVVVDAFGAAGDDPASVFADPDVIAAIEQITVFEVEVCGFEPPQPPSTDESTGNSDNDGLERLLLADDFDSEANGWGGGFQTFDDGNYVWRLPPGQSDARAVNTLIAIEDSLTQHRTTIEFTAGGAAAVAIECAWEEIDSSSRWYSLELTTEGAAILKRPPGNEPSTALATTDEVTLTDGPTTLEVICVLDADEYHLSLAVNGKTALDTVDTDPYGPGAPNIAVRSATDAPANEVTATFDRFETRVPDDGPTLPGDTTTEQTG